MALAVLLDLDGTLFDSFDAILHAMNAALAENDEPPLRDDELRPLVGMPVRRQMALLRGWEGPPVKRLAQRYYEYFDARVAEGLPLYPGVRDTLEALADRPLGTITTRRTLMARRMLRGAGLAGFFQAIVGGDAVPRPKPAPDLIHHAAGAIGRTAAESVAVGDSPVDLQAGRFAGARTVAALYGYGDDEALLAVDPDGEITRFPELLAVLAEIEEIGAER
ncbi:MAG: HAD family hydrolase [Thermoplasmata archaeon]